jgi:hypothetical protein
MRPRARSATRCQAGPPSPSEPDEDEQDLDLDLPPLDADEGDERADEAPEALDDPDAGGDLDDSNAAELDVGDELDDFDDEEGGDAEADVDVGPLDEGIDPEDDERTVGDEEVGATDGEGIAVDESHDADDGGAEGTSENPEDEVDEATLPDMDDGEDAGGDQALAEALLAESLAENGERLPDWAPARLALLEGAGAAVPCRSVVVAAGRVAAAGEVLLFVEEGARAARRLPFGDGVVAVALAEDTLLLATARGQLLTGRDAGTEATSLGAFRSGASTVPVQLAATPGRFWIRAGAALSCVTVPAPAPSRVRERGVLAIAASAGALIAVTLGPSGPGIERLRGDDEGGLESPLAGAARELVERAGDALLFAAAAGGRCLALGDGLRLVVSRDGGATFALLDPGPVAAVAFAGDGADAPLLALVAPEGAASAYLVRATPAGEASRIGELTSAERELPAAIAWDPARELVWVASGAGLFALGIPQRH